MKLINIGFFHYKLITSNIGDDIQTLAMIGMLKKMNQFHSIKFPQKFSEYDYIINPKSNLILNMIPLNRDYLSTTDHTINNIITVMNGWFMHKIDTDTGRSKFTKLVKKKLFNNNLDWPPPSNIKPIFISFHINNKDMLDNIYTDYYKQYEPIGCRDKSTSQYLSVNGINSYFSGCLTLTLDNIHKTENNGFQYYVDIPVGDNIQGKYITHQKKEYAFMDYTQRIPIAQKLLNGYAQAKSVTTNRVHVMLPCLAFGTKVNFIVKKQNDPRLTGILELIDNEKLLSETINKIETDFKEKVWHAVQKYYL